MASRRSTARFAEGKITSLYSPGGPLDSQTSDPQDIWFQSRDPRHLPQPSHRRRSPTTSFMDDPLCAPSGFTVQGKPARPLSWSFPSTSPGSPPAIASSTFADRGSRFHDTLFANSQSNPQSSSRTGTPVVAESTRRTMRDLVEEWKVAREFSVLLGGDEV
ncbi:hypothetical protein OF83DRAFT_1171640 [Amylostereum chailletii]|nr:hypothetical protein OF83DRAFT_1171640 [Amylostereum chailletii]